MKKNNSWVGSAEEGQFCSGQFIIVIQVVFFDYF